MLQPHLCEWACDRNAAESLLPQFQCRCFPFTRLSGLGPAQRTTGTWDDITAARFRAASSLSLKISSLSLSLGLFLFPQQSAEVSKTALELLISRSMVLIFHKAEQFAENLNSKGENIPHHKYWMSLGITRHVYVNHQISSLACLEDSKQTVYFYINWFKRTCNVLIHVHSRQRTGK